MKKLSVVCNSYNSSVFYKHDDNVLCVLRWTINENELAGFVIDSHNCLVDIYDKDFYPLDDSALSAFIINMADRIKLDQQMDTVEYIDSGGVASYLPMFLPNEIRDEDINDLPRYQIGVCKAWVAFVKEFNCSLYEDFLKYLDQQGLLAGFLDLVTVELSSLMKGINNE